MKESTYSFEAIGTSWSVTIVTPQSEARKIAILKKIQDRIDFFDKTYSRFREDSLITEISRKPGLYRLPPDADVLFSSYKKFYDVTGGKLTPLIGDVLVSAGYDASYSLLQSRELQTPLPWRDVFLYEYPKLLTKKKVMLDFGAGGKGYLVDIVAELLQKEGIDEFSVDAGGDMLIRGGNHGEFMVGLEDPQDTSKVIGRVALSNQSIAGSAGNRRVWGNFHHIIDPDLLTSPKHILALWVMADTTLLADLLATALFFVSPDELLVYFRFEYLLLNDRREVTQSEGFNAELFREE